MSSALFLQIITIVADAIIFVLVGFYLWTLQKDRNKLDKQAEELAKKEEKIENEYRQIIDTAHQKEKEIIDNAAKQANDIIANAQYVSNSSKETIEKALRQMITNIQQQAQSSSQAYMNDYKLYLDKVSEYSLNNFKEITKNFESEMSTQMQEFRNTMLSDLQKELDEYKQQRFKEAEDKINEIIGEVSQEVFNKSISLEDHKELIVKSLERSKKEGVFD